MKLYLDASALIKLLIREAESPTAVALWDDADRVISTGTIAVEAHAAIARRLRAPAAAVARRELARRLSDVILLEIDDVLLRQAAVAAERFRLRAPDAVHLAGALSAQDESLLFATWDRELSQAASRAGLTVAP